MMRGPRHHLLSNRHTSCCVPIPSPIRGNGVALRHTAVAQRGDRVVAPGEAPSGRSWLCFPSQQDVAAAAVAPDESMAVWGGYLHPGGAAAGHGWRGRGQDRDCIGGCEAVVAIQRRGVGECHGEWGGGREEGL